MEKENYRGNRLIQVHLEKWSLKRCVCVCKHQQVRRKIMHIFCKHMCLQSVDSIHPVWKILAPVIAKDCSLGMLRQTCTSPGCSPRKQTGYKQNQREQYFNYFTDRSFRTVCQKAINMSSVQQSSGRLRECRRFQRTVYRSDASIYTRRADRRGKRNETVDPATPEW